MREAIAHDACSWGITYAADGKFDGKSARLVSSSFTCFKGWSLPMSRARAAAGRASTVSNRRLRFGNGASGSSASFLTREARSSQHQRQEEHTSELQTLMRNTYSVFRLK